ncbi:MAG: ribonuclease P protein component 1 [Methanomicrobium sp.]|uniref:ribonuclease P protein component 1 n=1 Tax=Methanomicrobium mobile TaxID=2205 RepID=UPI0005B2C586|nr:ribonuclease P protein component 1 [Methanomicrobium mobile]MBP5083069.1 ribonuclease P protein component 1 [Methanomicrobium sp.]
MITPRNVCRHELLGLKTFVFSSTNPNQVGICGLIVDETKNMLVISSESGLKKVQKKGAAFDITLPDETRIRVDGSVLVMQPEKRISMRIKNLR